MVARIRELDGVTCNIPEGAFYVFPDVSGCFGGDVNSGEDVAKHLLERAKVAVVPGEAFGAPNHIRMSYAVSIERVREGMARIADALGELRRS
jgi:aspartate aminotransferase